MNILASILVVFLEIVPQGDAFMRPMQKRDSIYVGDRLEYGFELNDVKRAPSSPCRTSNLYLRIPLPW